MTLETDPTKVDTSLAPNGQQRSYLVLSDEELAAGYQRPVRYSYVHRKCGTVTKMNSTIAKTYARNPNFYTGTFCVGCGKHFSFKDELGDAHPDGAFFWDGMPQQHLLARLGFDPGPNWKPSCSYGCCPGAPGPNGEHADCCGAPGVPGVSGTSELQRRAQDDGPEVPCGQAAEPEPLQERGTWPWALKRMADLENELLQVNHCLAATEHMQVDTAGKLRKCRMELASTQAYQQRVNAQLESAKSFDARDWAREGGDIVSRVICHADNCDDILVPGTRFCEMHNDPRWPHNQQPAPAACECSPRDMFANLNCPAHHGRVLNRLCAESTTLYRGIDWDTENAWRNGTWDVKPQNNMADGIPGPELNIKWETQADGVRVMFRFGGRDVDYVISYDELRKAVYQHGVTMLINNGDKAFFVWPEQYAILEALKDWEQEDVEAFAVTCPEEPLAKVASAVLAAQRALLFPKVTKNRT